MAQEVLLLLLLLLPSDARDYLAVMLGLKRCWMAVRYRR